MVSSLFIGHTEITSVLLSHRECVCTSDENGATPLHYAAQNNFPVGANKRGGCLESGENILIL